jgi:hypothetical protein
LSDLLALAFRAALTRLATFVLGSDGSNRSYREAGVAAGRHVRYPGGTPLTNLYQSMLDRVGARLDAFGDSKGRLPSLEG